MDRTEAFQALASSQLVEVLETFAATNERVTLYLRNGTHLDGRLASATTSLVHLRELTGKEFYDAFLATDAIDGVEIRSRG